MTGTVDFTEGIRARVIRGEREPILWVHGFTIDSSVWCELWEALPEWTHIGIDLPGHGASGPIPDDCDLPQLARRIATAALQHRVAHVVGLSLGSMIALQVVAEAPRAFATLTLGAPALAGGPADPDAGLRYRQMVALYRQRGAGPWMTALWMSSPPAIFTWAAAHPLLWERLREVIDRHQWLELTGNGLPSLARYPQRLREIAQIGARTLLMVGQHEMPAFRQTASLLRDTIPGCEMVELPHVGHLCMLEAPQRSAENLRRHFGPPPELR